MLKPEVRDRIKYISSDQFGVDEKKRPAAEDVPQASFRKLNIDWAARRRQPRRNSTEFDDIRINSYHVPSIAEITDSMEDTIQDAVNIKWFHCASRLAACD